MNTNHGVLSKEKGSTVQDSLASKLTDYLEAYCEA